VLQFNPTDSQAPPAIKAWFYPGSRYGHEFIYPEEQARHIAERTKTVVLAVDVPGSDVEKGVLWTYDASGHRAPWRGDDGTMREWSAWGQTRADGVDPEERTRASATAVRGDFKGTRVELDDLEDNPQKYMGQRISVDGEVEEVYGPRIFTIDEPHWGDLDGEILVLLPTPLAALVKDDDRVTVSGTVKPFVKAEFEREWGWLGLDAGIETRVSMKPVLVAERLIGGDDNTALVINADPEQPRPVGTSGRGRTINDPAAVGEGGLDHVGQPVTLSGVRVSGNTSGSGFFVEAGDHPLFVLPSKMGATLASGDKVDISGIVLRMPKHMIAKLDVPAKANTDIYVYANAVRK
jgi:hypothetical protein